MRQAGAIKTGQVPGLVVGISGQDAEIYFKAAGNNVVGDPSRGKITDDSVFWICSQTKMIVSVYTFVALALLRLSLLTTSDCSIAAH